MSLRRALLLAAPRGAGGGRGGGRRGLCAGTPPQAGAAPPPGTAPRIRELRERRQRRRLERAAGGGDQVPPAPPRGWAPAAGAEFEGDIEEDGWKGQGPLPPSYSPRYVEAGWYRWWQQRGLFTPPPAPAGGQERLLSMVLPPPNVTGSLHVGHALGTATQDALARWHRMQGWTVLWVPGTDHAGIATQAVVERWLWQQRGLQRQDLTREEFVREAWEWRERHGDQILQQLRRLGASLDWSRCTFTMDPGYSAAVTEAFVRLHGARRLYRAERLVNWSCALRCALADIEVEHRWLPGPTSLRIPGYSDPVTFGVIVTVAFPVEGDDDQEVLVATTRPETLFGDVAVAVNPNDPRYQHLHGRHLRHPLSGRLLPLVTDSSVDPHMGTGAVKVTPGHSVTDLALARAHRLPLISVIADDGTLCPPGGGWLQGVPRFAARPQVLAALAERRLLRGTQDHAMTLPLCSRSGDVIEFLLKSQWFLRCREMAERAREAVTSGQLQLVPKFHEKSWKHWMDNVEDWCLSRQLCWGHRVPAWAVEGPGEPWAVGRDEAAARGAAAAALGCPPGDLHMEQDPDVLDTWFSSALFPFAALGWPQQGADLGRFYPTTLLVTGRDLLFFWVARMVMLGLELTGQLPFQQVLLHPLVRDAHGRKMSKSLGNVLDPRDVIAGATLQELQEKLRGGILERQELDMATKAQRRQFPHGLPECGADALRLALCIQSGHGDSVRLDVQQLLAQRRFCTKIWNALRFIMGALGDTQGLQPPEEVDPQGPLERQLLGCVASAIVDAERRKGTHGDMREVTPEGPLERWLLGRLAQTVAEAERRMEALEPHGALGAAQQFWLSSFCDVYLEAVKPTLRTGGPAAVAVRTALLTAADLGLRLLSPFAPFVSEELWQRLPRAGARGDSVTNSRMPPAHSLARWICPRTEADVAAMLEVARAVRGLRDTLGLSTARPPVLLRCPEALGAALGGPLGPALQTLARAGPLRLLPSGAGPDEGAGPGAGWVGASAEPHGQVYLHIEGLVSPGSLRSRQQSLQHRLGTLEQRAQASGSPPPQVADLRAQLARLDEALAAIDPPPPRDPASRQPPPCP